MKQILVLLALPAMLVCSCSSGEDGTELKQEWPAFTLDKTEVKIYAHETAGIIPSEAFTAWSENEKVATVDADGIIHGISEGETDIVFKANASGKETRCQAKVSWRYHYYEEPLLAWDSSQEEIRANETHTLISEETEGNGHLYYLTYDYGNQLIPMNVSYRFDVYTSVYGARTELKMVSFSLKEETGHFEKIKLQLDERYGNTEEQLPGHYSDYRTYHPGSTYIVHTPWEFVYMLLY